MIPKSLSASSVLVSEQCMERWKHENFMRTPQPNSAPAMIGSSVHYALEFFVKAVYIDKTNKWDEVDLLTDLYKMGYTVTFGSADFSTEEFADGAALVAKWYEYNKEGLKDQVLSVEIKESFDVKTSIGVIPWNYIYDRIDQIDETTFRVVDYKTWRVPRQPDDMRKAIQPRSYALAAQIKYPQAKKIWVTYDQLRYDPVGIVFTREENATTYRYIQRAAERIIATDEDMTQPTLNPDCKWCIVKATCPAIEKAATAGSPYGLSIDAIAERKLRLQSALDAIKYADEELDRLLLAEAEKRDVIEFDTESAKVEITSSSRRALTSPTAVAKILGPELTAKYGNFTLGNIDKILKTESLDPAVTAQVKSYITRNWGEPRAKVKPLNPFGDD